MSTFREDGAAALDWVARYLERVAEYPVMARVEPGEVRAAPAGRSRDTPVFALLNRSHRPYFAPTCWGCSSGPRGERLAASHGVRAAPNKGEILQFDYVDVISQFHPRSATD